MASYALQFSLVLRAWLEELGWGVGRGGQLTDKLTSQIIQWSSSSDDLHLSKFLR